MTDLPSGPQEVELWRTGSPALRFCCALVTDETSAQFSSFRLKSQ